MGEYGIEVLVPYPPEYPISLESHPMPISFLTFIYIIDME